MTTGILALIIFAAIFVQITVAVLIGLYRRRRQYRNLDEQGGEAQTLIESHASAPSADKPVTNVYLFRFLRLKWGMLRFTLSQG